MSAKAKSVEFIGTGRRKTSTARVRIKEGTGIFVINGRDLADYCKTEQQRKTAFSPLATVEKGSSCGCFSERFRWWWSWSGRGHQTWSFPGLGKNGFRTSRTVEKGWSFAT